MQHASMVTVCFSYNEAVSGFVHTRKTGTGRGTGTGRHAWMTRPVTAPACQQHHRAPAREACHRITTARSPQRSLPPPAGVESPGFSLPCLQLPGNGKVRLPAKPNGAGVADAQGGYGFEFDAAYRVDRCAQPCDLCFGSFAQLAIQGCVAVRVAASKQAGAGDTGTDSWCSRCTASQVVLALVLLG